MQYTKKQIRDYHKSMEAITAFVNKYSKNEYMKSYTDCEVYLKRTRFLLDILGNPEKKIKNIIHVTGTSGKGSTTQMIHEILLASGKKVGSTYSPHPTTFIERIRVNNKYISITEFTRLTNKLIKKLEIVAKKSPYGMVSFFEAMFAMTMLHFAEKKVTHAVIEVCMGGRYDASNSLTKTDINIITNIGLDHTDLLGNSKLKIAHEKAGIIKKGAVVITGEKNKKVLEVIKKEIKIKKPKKIIHVDLPTDPKTSLSGTTFIYKGNKYQMPLIGNHQASNAVIAIETAKELKIPQKSIERGLSKITRPVCFEIIQKKPLIIIDGAHNTDKMNTTKDTLKQVTKERDTKGNVHLIISITENKKVDKILKSIAPLATHVYCTKFTQNSFRKPVDPRDLAARAKRINKNTKSYNTPKQALDVAMRNSKKEDIILITGSIFLAGELRNKWVTEKKIIETRKPYAALS